VEDPVDEVDAAPPLSIVSSYVVARTDERATDVADFRPAVVRILYE
jgi:hypothetical protein